MPGTGKTGGQDPIRVEGRRMLDDNKKPDGRLLNARARGQALIDLSKKYPAEYRRFYLIRKREQYASAGVPLSRRHIRHRDDGTGFCVSCGEVFPCPPAVRRMNRSGNGGKRG